MDPQIDTMTLEKNANLEKQRIPVHRNLTPRFTEKPHASLQAAHKIKKASGFLFLACTQQPNCSASLNRRSNLPLHKGTGWEERSSTAQASPSTMHKPRDGHTLVGTADKGKIPDSIS